MPISTDPLTIDLETVLSEADDHASTAHYISVSIPIEYPACRRLRDYIGTIRRQIEEAWPGLIHTDRTPPRPERVLDLHHHATVAVTVARWMQAEYRGEPTRALADLLA